MLHGIAEMIAAKQAVKELCQLFGQIGRHGIFGALRERLFKDTREKHARKRRRMPEGILVLHIVAEFLKCLPDARRIPHFFQNGKVRRKGGRSAVNRREPVPGHIAHAERLDIASVLLCNPLCHDALRSARNVRVLESLALGSRYFDYVPKEEIVVVIVGDQIAVPT